MHPLAGHRLELASDALSFAYGFLSLKASPFLFSWNQICSLPGPWKRFVLQHELIPSWEPWNYPSQLPLFSTSRKAASDFFSFCLLWEWEHLLALTKGIWYRDIHLCLQIALLYTLWYTARRPTRRFCWRYQFSNDFCFFLLPFLAIFMVHWRLKFLLQPTVKTAINNNRKLSQGDI